MVSAKQLITYGLNKMMVVHTHKYDHSCLSHERWKRNSICCCCYNSQKLQNSWIDSECETIEGPTYELSRKSRGDKTTFSSIISPVYRIQSSGMFQMKAIRIPYSNIIWLYRFSICKKIPWNFKINFNFRKDICIFTA